MEGKFYFCGGAVLKFFRTLQWRLMAILFLLIICLMMTVGTFLIRSIEETYSNSFISDMVRFENELNNSNVLSADVVAVDETYKDELFKVFKTYYQIDGTTKKGYLLSETGKIVLPTDKAFIDETLEITDNIILAESGKVGSLNLEADYFDYAKPVMKNGKVEYIFYLKQDKSTINEIVSSLKQSILYVMMAALGISVIISYILAKAITIPVSKLTKSAEKMANGDFSGIKEIKSGDEISLLASKFNYMAKRLQSTLGEISKEKVKLEAVLQNMSDGVVAFNAEGELIHANPSGQEFLRISGDSLKLNDVFSALNLHVTFENIMSSQEQHEGMLVEIEGKVLNLLFAKLEVDAENNIGVIVVIQDYTEQEKLERMRKEFVANVSHELKTPITSISGYSETLLENAGSLDNETEHKFLTVIHNEAERMAHLVSDLLKLSKMDFQVEEVNKNEFDIVRVIRNDLDKLAIEANKKSQKLININENESIFVYANETDIEQVILNILSNSIKYTPEGGMIEIGAERHENEVEILIKDNGIGIPKEDLQRVFERFYRVDKARSREMGGTGLGLSISKKLINASGGQISMDSEVGVGTTVRIVLKANRE